MKKIILSILCFTLILEMQAQTCASAYDNAFNNTTIPTHYFPGPFSIPLNTDVNGRIEVASDIDYYKFFITRGGTITLTLRNLPANYNLNLVNSSGRSIASSARTGTSSETINFTAASNTEYFALVSPANSKTLNASACYTLRVATGTAARLSAPAVRNSGIYPNPVSNTANIQLNEIKGITQIRIMNLAGGLLVQKSTIETNTSLDLSRLPSGIYLLDAIDHLGKTIYRSKLVKQ